MNQREIARTVGALTMTSRWVAAVPWSDHCSLERVSRRPFAPRPIIGLTDPQSWTARSGSRRCPATASSLSTSRPQNEVESGLLKAASSPSKLPAGQCENCHHRKTPALPCDRHTRPTKPSFTTCQFAVAGSRSLSSIRLRRLTNRIEPWPL